MNLIYSPRSVRDLHQIATYYSEVADPKVARDVSECIERTVDRIANQPESAPRVNFTVSQISLLRTCWHCSLTTRASRQVLGERDNQALAHGGDRIWYVALGPQWRRRGVGNRRER
jgi:plasmid stabilization system protein ParE